MKATFELNAELRSDKGKGASRRLRRVLDKVPGIVYGGKEAPALIMVDHKKLMHALEHEAFYSHLLTLHLPNEQTQQVILKDLHRHHFKKAIMHVDFQRVHKDDVITMKVPLHFINESTCPGVKAGGIINHQLTEVEIRCKAGILPEFIEVDLGNLELNSSIHLSDLKLLPNTDIVALLQGEEFNTSVVNVHLPKTLILDEVSSPAASAVPAINDKAALKANTPAASAKGDSKNKK
ncbi:MAG: rplY [Francisellaceae bacterium]|nr:rplY [Francisellaceae bacterium]